MKICWFDDNKLGLVHDGMVFDVSAALEHLPPQPYPGPPGDPLIANLETLWPHIESASHGAVGKPVSVLRCFLRSAAWPNDMLQHRQCFRNGYQSNTFDYFLVIAAV